MLKRAKTRIFPLHLAPIDEFFLLDDRASHPMAFTSHLHFTGEIDREAFEHALIESLIRHPLLQALIKPAKAGKPCWVAARDLLPTIHWGEIGEAFEFADEERIDLSKEVGLRIWVRTANDRSEILLQFHHACCDGTGAYRFIGDLLAEYGIRTATGKERPVIELCDPTLLKDRRTKMAGNVASESKFGNIKRGLSHAASVFFRKITPLSSPNIQLAEHGIPSEFQHSPYPGIVTKVFEKSKYKLLRDAAGASGAMFNDLLLSEMFAAMRDWNKQHGNHGKQWLRILMPTDLRGKDEITMPAANMTAYSFITRSDQDCDDSATLLRSICDETLQIKREQGVNPFLDSITLSRVIPGLTKFLLDRKRCLATVILSNVGDPSRRFLARFPRQGGRVICGNLRLERISGVPPLRPLSRATVSIVTYGREFAINVRCDPNSMTHDDAKEFLELFSARLAQHLPEEVEVAKKSTTEKAPDSTATQPVA